MDNITKREALLIANAFFKGMDGTKTTSLLETPTHYIGYNVPEGKVRIGGCSVKIDRLTGEAEDFILPDDENFRLLDEAVEIDISQI